MLGPALVMAVAVALGPAAAASPPAPPHAELAIPADSLRAGVPAHLAFTVRGANGRAIRFLQFVHERPMHLIIVSDDLASFAHVHPELGVTDAYELDHAFPAPGRYRLYADYAPPGFGPQVDRFDVTVAGAPRPRVPLVADDSLAHAAGGVRITLAPDHPLRAREDALLQIVLADSATGAPITDLQLYLGALAHLVIVSQDLGDFIHAHPLETGEVYDPSADPNAVHVHDPALLAKVLRGPSPAVLRAAVSFPHAGRYKIWVQVQRHDRVVTVPFVVRVGGAAPATRLASDVAPAGAVRIVAGASGYEPARIDLRRGEPVVLAFTRPTAGNCIGTVVIPGLDVRRDLPVGGTVVVRFTPAQAGEIPFACGMGMYQGLIVVR